MAVIVTRSTDRWALLPTLAEMTLESVNRPNVAEQIVGVKGSDYSPLKTGVITHDMVNLGAMQNWGETNPIPFDSPGPGYTKQSAYADYGVAVAFSRNALEDDLHGVYQEVASGMGQSYTLLRNLIVARLISNIFSTTYFTAEDGLAVCSTSHTSAGGGGTRQNMLSVSASLSYTSAQNMLLLGWRQKDHRGNPAPAWGDGDTIQLVIQPEDTATAVSIVDSMSVKVPQTNYNDPNVLTRLNTFEVVKNPYVNQSGAGRYWGFVKGGSDKSIFFVDRRPLEASNYRDNATKAMIYDLTARLCLHVKSWKDYYFSGN